MYLWERYFLYEFIKVFFLFLFCFYGLYILIDYASHTSALPQNTLHLKTGELLRYYLYIFASRAEILIPIALLIAFIKTVCTLNTNNELVALMASGFKLKTLMRPFLFMGLFCTLLLFLNEQFLLPKALKKLRRIEDLTKHNRSRQDQSISVKQVILEDGSLLLFQHYDSIKEQFFDVFWVQTIDNIYRIKYLTPSGIIPVGYFVDHLMRQPNGELLQQVSHKMLEFPAMHFNQKVLQSTILDPEILSLTELFTRYREVTNERNEKESKLLTAFYWKVALPWLCLLAILIPAPFCVRFSRQVPVFLIYVGCLFGFLAFYMLLDATQVIANRQVIPAVWAIGAPFIAAFCWSGYRYYRMS
jgi:lipopolysaccharide export system permease protein